MLLLRCSLLADSMSRSISFWPSTMATRSSSAWVALNSMRIIVFSRRGSGRACGFLRNGDRAPRAALRYRAAEDDDAHRPGGEGQGHARGAKRGLGAGRLR